MGRYVGVTYQGIVGAIVVIAAFAALQHWLLKPRQHQFEYLQSSRSHVHPPIATPHKQMLYGKA